jgi:hypothetical protein
VAQASPEQRPRVARLQRQDLAVLRYGCCMSTHGLQQRTHVQGHRSAMFSITTSSYPETCICQSASAFGHECVWASYTHRLSSCRLCMSHVHFQSSSNTPLVMCSTDICSADSPTQLGTNVLLIATCYAVCPPCIGLHQTGGLT